MRCLARFADVEGCIVNLLAKDAELDHCQQAHRTLFRLMCKSTIEAPLQKGQETTFYTSFGWQRMC